MCKDLHAERRNTLVRGWSPFSLASEVCLSIIRRPVQSGLLVAVIALILGSVAAAEGGLASRAVTGAQEAISAGSDVVVVTSRDGGVSTRRCASLNSVAGIRAGAARQAQLTTISASPGESVRTMEVSAVTLEILAGKQVGDGTIFLGSALAERLALSPDRYLVAGGEVLRVDGIVDPVRAMEASGRLLIVRAPDSGLGDCWVSFPRALASTNVGLLPWWFESEQLVVEEVGGESIAGLIAQWSNRSTRHAPWLGALVVLLLVALTVRGRRNESSLYLVNGCSRVVAGLLITGEFIVLLACGGLMGTGWAMLLITLDAAAPSSAYVVAGRAALLCALVVAAGIPALGLLQQARDPVQSLKDRI